MGTQFFQKYSSSVAPLNDSIVSNNSDKIECFLV